MNASEFTKINYHKKSQSVDLKKKLVLTNVDKFKLINNKNINNSNNKTNYTSKNKSPNFTKTSNNFNKTGTVFGTTTNKDFYKTFRNPNSNFNLNQFNKRFKLENPELPFESYRDSTKDIMSEYHYDASSKKPLDISLKKLFLGDENFEKIKNNLSRKISIPSFLEPISCEAKMKIFINSEDYKSPVKAFGVIWKNKIIHENVSKNSYSRQKNKYDEFLRKVNEFEKLTNNKHRKIKITSVIQNKNDEGFSFGSDKEQLKSTSPNNSAINLNNPFNKSIFNNFTIFFLFKKIV